MNWYWMTDAERVHEGGWIGEDDNGVFYVEKPRSDRWVRFSRWNLRHWWVYLKSHRANRVTWLEATR